MFRLFAALVCLVAAGFVFGRHASYQDLGASAPLGVAGSGTATPLRMFSDSDTSNSHSSNSSTGASKFPEQVSVVMMNWERPANVIKIIDKYVKYKLVGEIIVWMCHPDTKFSYKHPKVRIIDDDGASNKKHGVATRFVGCLEAKFDWVLIQDDDHYAQEDGLFKFLIAKRAYPTRTIGAFGRDWSPVTKPVYSKEPKGHGPRPIVLTSLMLTDKDTCHAFWEHAPKVTDYINRNSKPLWNGEDIFFCLVSYKKTGQIPLAVKMKKTFMPQKDTGIHFGTAHDEYRDKFLRYAIEQLGISYEGQTFGWKSGERKPFLAYNEKGQVVGLNTNGL